VSAVTVAASAKAKLRKQLTWSKTPIVPTIIVVIVLAFLPLVWRNDYIISLLVLMLLFSIMTQSWNLTIGMCGIWNFGQLAIIAIGGYATGLLTIKLGWSAWMALPGGIVAGGLAAVIMVLPSIRLRGIYASMLTFAFAEVVRLLIIADSSGFTGGPFGLNGVTGLFDNLSSSASLRAYFWLCLVLCAVVMLLVHRMMNSPFGMGLVSLRESIRFSIGMGINRRVQFVMATLISGLIAGLAGGLYATFYHGITPSSMGLGPMGLLVIMVVVGGLGTVRGPIIGAFAVTILSELLRDTVMWRLVVQGALLLLVLAFFPAGIDGFLQRSYNKILVWMNAGQAGGQTGPEAAVATAGAPSAATGSSAAASPGGDAAASAGGTAAVTAAAGHLPLEKKQGRFMTWLNADQPKADEKPGAGKTVAVETAAAQVEASAPQVEAPAPKPEAPAPQAAAGKPAKKQGRFMTWLNADQPKPDQKPDGSGGDRD
jgi:branched-chain amino acid transport system permease protein